jgi:hypothetical protein
MTVVGEPRTLKKDRHPERRPQPERRDLSFEVTDAFNPPDLRSNRLGGIVMVFGDEAMSTIATPLPRSR